MPDAVSPGEPRLRGPESYRTTPWRNGGGVTTELAIAPEGATVADAFDWRLSTALVASSGPFSRFEGCDRTLLLLEGEGMDLDHASKGRAALGHLFQPLAFSGDWDTTGTLRGGPCRDFNVITRRARWRQAVEVVLGGPVAPPATGLALIYVARGAFRLEPLGSLLPEGHLLEARETVTLGAASGDAAAVVVRLWPAG